MNEHIRRCSSFNDFTERVSYSSFLLEKTKRLSGKRKHLPFIHEGTIAITLPLIAWIEWKLQDRLQFVSSSGSFRVQQTKGYVP